MSEIVSKSLSVSLGVRMSGIYIEITNENMKVNSPKMYITNP